MPAWLRLVGRWRAKMPPGAVDSRRLRAEDVLVNGAYKLRRDETPGCDLEDDCNLNTFAVGCDVRQRTTVATMLMLGG